VLVVSPLISLMRDQVAALRALGIPAGCVHSGQPESEKRGVFREIRAGGPFVLYLSPERVQKDGFARWLAGQPVLLFAIDEAHCVSQWGHDFRPEYQQLSLLRALRPELPILALTATATPQVVQDIARSLKMRDPSQHIHGFYRPNLHVQITRCRNEEDKQLCLEQALRQNPSGRVIVYCGTRKASEAIAAALSERFAGVGHYHAGLSPEERTRIQEDFSSARLRILTATNAFGMGIDHPDVRLIVHHQMPGALEAYYQEMGRAGRDGAPATCLLLYAKKDKGLHSYFIRQSDAPVQVISQRWNALDAMTAYLESQECRHAGILTYFHDTQRLERCGHCDVCAPDSPLAIRVPSMAAAAPRKRRGARARHAASPGAPEGRSGPQGSVAAWALEGVPLSLDEQAMAHRVREWRKAWGKANDLPAFMVFTDRTLHALARNPPTTLDELLEIPGIGQHKLDAFGVDLLRILNEAADGDSR
jgi:ATP-dependent DNA helicase RecQ